MSLDIQHAVWIPWLPLFGAVLALICCVKRPWRKLAAPISVGSIFVAFLLAVAVYPNVPREGFEVVTALKWIYVGDLEVDFGYFMDPLTMVMLFVVTGIGSLVALYATGYMAGDRGYARFFAAVSLFIFAMASMVMADNLVLLFLGWEMVGLASFLLIGYYYEKPSAVAAAKKAFIVNRVGDLGFALGIFTVFYTFGSVKYADFIPAVQAMLGSVDAATLEGGAAAAYARATAAPLWMIQAAPFLLLAGALGKSAQIPFYVWLPDAMEGPSPVSALIHAATMVTSGVYMIARLLPLYELSPYALTAVATIGGVTALFAATIALAQNDIKRVFAFSTVSQLGYMILGVGVLSVVGGMWHLISHAFFKGLLFLTAGNVMHAMAGQLDLRKMSGLRHKMPVTCWLMFAACLSLAGIPFTAGFWSKDLIIAAAFDRAQMTGAENVWFAVLGVMGLLTAFITASYGFRVWFRVFLGPERYEMGEEHHGGEEDTESHAAAAEHRAPAHDAHDHAHDDHHGGGGPHEMPWWPMNLPLLVLAVGALLSWLVVGFGPGYAWIGASVAGSTGEPMVRPEYGTLLGMDVHTLMLWVSGTIAIVAVALAAYLHWLNRDAATKLANATRPVVRVLHDKYYVDELYDLVFRRPLRVLGQIFYGIDQLIINGLVYSVAWLPRLLGYSLRPLQHGKLQGYGLGMAGGVAVIALLIWAMIAP